MSPGFDWQTEEDAKWSEKHGPREARLRGRRRFLLPAIAVVVLLGVAAFLLVRRLNQRIDDVAAFVESDVLASYHLVRYASENRDKELFSSFLSGRDPEWSAMQERLVDAGVIYGREGLGLKLLPAGSLEGMGQHERLQELAVTLAPALDEAEVTAARAYAVEAGNGLTSTIYLRQSGIYRLGPNRWLYSPPKDGADYWGEWREVTGAYLIVLVRERDAEIGERLAADLDTKLAELCSHQGFACPQDWRATLRLSDEAEALLSLNQDGTEMGGTGELSLPTPSLVGLPADNAAYHALYRGYARLLVGSAIHSVLGYQCCDKILFHQAVLAWEWQELGLVAPPLLPEDYLALVGALPDEAGLGHLARVTEPEVVPVSSRRELLALAAFLRHESGFTSFDIHRRLAASATLQDWFLALGVEEVGPRWQAFVEAEARSASKAASNSPEPMPDQDIALICNATDAGEAVLTVYDPRLDAWSELLRWPAASARAVSLPDDGGLLLYPFRPGEGEPFATALWYDGDVLVLRLPSGAQAPVPLDPQDGTVDPRGQFTAMGLRAGLDGPIFKLTLVDLEACLSGECGWQPISGLPFWSADGNHLLVFDPQTTRILLSDRSFEQWRELTATGWNPFWLDADTFGYAEGDAVFLGTVGSGAGPILSTPELAERIPGEEAGALPTIARVTTVPGRQDALIVTVQREESETAWSFEVKLNSRGMPEEIELLAEHAVAGSLAGKVSGDGRWLALISDNGDDASIIPLAGDTGALRATGSPDSFGIDFSEDGSWLVQGGANFLRLLRFPDDESVLSPQLVFHEKGPCGPPLWIDS